MGYPRERVELRKRLVGHFYYKLNGGVVADEDKIAECYNYCADELGGIPVPQPLQITKTIKETMPTLNGEKIDGGGVTIRRFTDCPSGWQQTSSLSHVSLPWLSNAADATKAMARSNPNRPAVDIPVSLFELHELPSLLKGAGKTVLNNGPVRDGSSLYLQWQFGWAPLYRDLLGLLDFMDAYRKRAIEVSKLYEKGGLRKRVNLDTFTRGDSTNRQIWSVSANLVVHEKRVTHGWRWAVVRWRPLNGLNYHDVAVSNRIRNALLGLTPGLSTLWQIIPWSWLIDWCSTYGDFLVQFRNTIPCYMANCCVMTHTITKYGHQRIDSSNWVSGGSGEATYETKQRSVHYSPTLSASLPFFTGRQLSILGALAVIKSGYRPISIG